MRLDRLLIPLIVVASVLAVTVAGYYWRSGETKTAANSPGEQSQASGEATNKTIIVGDQAQRNLALSAKPLKSESFWKTIAVQGMVVDRPGISDLHVVAPATGVVAKIFHVPGDVVRPGDALFNLRLTGDSLHQAQTALFKTSQDIKLAETRLDRLVAAGEGVPQVRVIEVESEITRLEAAAKSSRHELLIRGFTPTDLEQVASGALIKEISVTAPQPTSLAMEPNATQVETAPHAFELQSLQVETGQEVQAGETLSLLANHQSLAIEGRAFRDETLLLERTIKEGWPVEVDFQESAGADWPPLEQSLRIQHLANTIDPVTRTFAFRIPLENQFKLVAHDDKAQLLWRFRPGQKVRLEIRVDELTDVFVLPADAVVREGGDAFVFTQNVNTFERKPVHVVLRDRDHVVIANDGSLPTYLKGKGRWTLSAIVRNAAAQLNRMTKAGSSEVPKGFHIHADGSLHKNEDEGK